MFLYNNAVATFIKSSGTLPKD